MVGWCCNGMSDVLLFMKSYMIKNADFLGKSYVSLSVHYLTLATLFESVLPVYTCEMFYFVWSLLIIIIVNHYWLKISQKTIPLLVHCEGFFRKTKFSSAFIVVNLRFFSGIHCCFVFWRFHWTCLGFISALKEEKNKNEL